MGRELAVRVVGAVFITVVVGAFLAIESVLKVVIVVLRIGVCDLRTPPAASAENFLHGGSLASSLFLAVFDDLLPDTEHSRVGVVNVLGRSGHLDVVGERARFVGPDAGK